MKKATKVIACLFLLAISKPVTANTNSLNKIQKDGANDTLTVTFKVNGNAACESSIEGVLTGKAGVISTNWDPSTKNVTVKFLPAQIQQSDLYTYFALAGYDNAELRAKQPAYDALSQDCKYTRDPDHE